MRDRLETAARHKRGAEAEHLQALEGNPLSADEKEMFAMFEREGWSFERRRDHINALFANQPGVRAAE